MTSNKIVKKSDIIRYADRLATAIRKNLSWSRKLKGTVIVENPKETANGISISISVGKYALDPRGMPLSGMARAFEYGSGVHATRGRKGKYLIKPINGKRLAFAWPKASPPFIRGRKLAGQLPDGRLSFFYVEHPGVSPKPFIKPARISVVESSRKELTLSIRNNIKNELGIIIRGKFK